MNGLEFVFIRKIIVFLSLFFVIGFCKKIEENPNVKHGFLNLSNWNFADKDLLPLNGEWEFYWEEFLTEGGAKSSKYIYVPSPWNDFTLNGKKIGGMGFGSYRLKILLPKHGSKKLAIKLPNMGTSYRVYLNGKKVFQAGKPGKSPDSFQPYYQTSIIKIPDSLEELELIIQVSNFIHHSGGFWYSAYIGVYEEIQKAQEKNIFLDLFFAGSFFTIAIYHLGIYFQRRKDISILYFGIFALFIAIRPLVTKEFVIFKIFSSIPWHIVLRMDYASFYVGTPIFILFIYSIFYSKRNIKLIKSLITLTFLQIYFCLFAPIHTLSQILQWVETLVLLAVLYSISLIVIGLIRKIEGSWILFFGYFVFSIVVTNDILYDMNYIHSDFYLPIGFMFFVLSQTLYLSMRFANVFAKVEELSESLEEKVKIRTKELEKANELKDKFVMIVSHDLRSPITGVIYLLENIKDNFNKMKKEEIKKYLNLAYNSLKYSLNMTDEVLNLTKIEYGKISLSYCLVNIYELVAKLKSELLPSLIHKNIELKIDIHEHEIITVDPKLFSQILRNIISNSIKFTNRGGTITIRFYLENNFHKIEIKDTGKGISPKTLPKLFEPSRKFFEYGTDGEKSKGIGLLIAKEFIHFHKGEITASNNPDKGACFTISIPCNEKTILIADDSETYLNELSESFRREGWLVIGVRNGDELLDVAKNVPPEIIITDKNMPILNGLEAIKRLTTNADFGDTLIFLLSADFGPEFFQNFDDNTDFYSKRITGFLSRFDSIEKIKETVLNHYYS